MTVSELKLKSLQSILDKEGGYVNDPSDSGGETNYGITIRVARNAGYQGKMRDLSVAMAREIYSYHYWDKLKLSEIAVLSPILAEELFDTGVNMGTKRAGEFLQRSLNVFNHSGNLRVDGAIGPNTLRALAKFIKRRGKAGDLVLKKAVDSLQGSFYIELAERRIKDKKFIYGWFKNRVG